MFVLDHVGFDFLHPKGFRIDVPAGHADYLFLLFKKEVTVIFADKTIYGQKNSVMIIKKGTPHAYFNEQEDYTHDFVHFQYDGLTSCSHRQQFPITRCFRAANIWPISQIVQTMAQEALLDEPFTRQVLHSLFLNLIYKTSNILHSTVKYEHARYQAFLALRNDIYAAPQSPWRVEDMCAGLHLSQSRFAHLYKMFFKTTPMKDVICSRVQLAKYLLASTDLKISAVSDACGYENEEHFIRQFKAATGKSPGLFRGGQKQ